MTSYRDDTKTLLGGPERTSNGLTSSTRVIMGPSNIRFKSNLFTAPRVLLLCVIAGVFLVYTGFFGVFSWNQKVDLKQLLSASIELAERGGKEVRDIHNAHKGLHEKVKGETQEGAKEMLTEGDLTSHRAMVYGLLKAFPNINVISEEKEVSDVDMDKVKMPDIYRDDVKNIVGETVPMSDVTVWIDPLDATQEYTESLTWYVTTMICIAVKGQPTIGVIHQPFKQETAWGYVNHGHSNNLETASAKQHKEGSPYKIIVSRSHAGSVEAVAKEALGADTEIIPAGGAGFKTLQVIGGNADAYVHVTRIKKWDICSGNAIINTMGGTMTTLHNTHIDYSMAGSELNDEGLLITLSEHDKFLNALKPAYDKTKQH